MSTDFPNNLAGKAAISILGAVLPKWYFLFAALTLGYKPASSYCLLLVLGSRAKHNVLPARHAHCAIAFLTYLQTKEL